jgi:hypothetical protein
LLVSMAEAAEQWRQQGASAVPIDERDDWIAQYFEVLVTGFAAQPVCTAQQVPKKSAGSTLAGEVDRAPVPARFCGPI